MASSITPFKAIIITPSSARTLFLCVAIFCGLLPLGKSQPYRDSLSNTDADSSNMVAAMVAKRSGGGMLSCRECKVLRDQCFENQDVETIEKQFICVKMCSQICKSKKNTKREKLANDDGEMSDNQLSYDELLFFSQ